MTLDIFSFSFSLRNQEIKQLQQDFHSNPYDFNDVKISLPVRYKTITSEFAVRFNEIFTLITVLELLPKKEFLYLRVLSFFRSLLRRREI